MKRRRSSGKFILAVSLLIVLGVLTVAYATLSTTLQIKGGGTIEADTNFVKFVPSDPNSGDYTIDYDNNNTVANISITKKFTSDTDYVYIGNIKIKNYKSDMNAKLNEVTLELNQEKLTPISYSGGLTFENDYINIYYSGPFNSPGESAYILAAEADRNISLEITCKKVPTGSNYDFNFSLSMDWVGVNT